MDSLQSRLATLIRVGCARVAKSSVGAATTMGSRRHTSAHSRPSSQQVTAPVGYVPLVPLSAGVAHSGRQQTANTRLSPCTPMDGIVGPARSTPPVRPAAGGLAFLTRMMSGLGPSGNTQRPRVRLQPSRQVRPTAAGYVRAEKSPVGMLRSIRASASICRRPDRSPQSRPQTISRADCALTAKSAVGVNSRACPMANFRRLSFMNSSRRWTRSHRQGQLLQFRQTTAMCAGCALMAKSAVGERCRKKSQRLCRQVRSPQYLLATSTCAGCAKRGAQSAGATTITAKPRRRREAWIDAYPRR